MLGRDVAAVAAGGVLGACARHGAGLLWPGVWTTVGVNVLGCLLMGVLLALAPRWRLFLGTGVLGGFTTFSAAELDVLLLVDEGRAATAAGYLLATVGGALGAVWAGTALGRRAAGRCRAPGDRPVPGRRATGW